MFSAWVADSLYVEFLESRDASTAPERRCCGKVRVCMGEEEEEEEEEKVD